MTHGNRGLVDLLKPLGLVVCGVLVIVGAELIGGDGDCIDLFGHVSVCNGVVLHECQIVLKICRCAVELLKEGVGIGVAVTGGSRFQRVAHAVDLRLELLAQNEAVLLGVLNDCGDQAEVGDGAVKECLLPGRGGVVGKRLLIKADTALQDIQEHLAVLLIHIGILLPEIVGKLAVGERPLAADGNLLVKHSGRRLLLGHGVGGEAGGVLVRDRHGTGDALLLGQRRAGRVLRSVVFDFGGDEDRRDSQKRDHSRQRDRQLDVLLRLFGGCFGIGRLRRVFCGGSALAALRLLYDFFRRVIRFGNFFGRGSVQFFVFTAHVILVHSLVPLSAAHFAAVSAGNRRAGNASRHADTFIQFTTSALRLQCAEGGRI